MEIYFISIYILSVYVYVPDAHEISSSNTENIKNIDKHWIKVNSDIKQYCIQVVDLKYLNDCKKKLELFLNFRNLLFNKYHKMNFNLCFPYTNHHY